MTVFKTDGKRQRPTLERGVGISQVAIRKPSSVWRQKVAVVSHLEQWQPPLSDGNSNGCNGLSFNRVLKTEK